MKILIAGNGQMGKNYQRSLQHTDLKICNSLKGYKDILSEEPSVQAVILAVPYNHSFSMAKHALNLGKHVFIDKPVCQTHEEARILVELAHQKNAVLMAGHIIRYMDIFDELSVATSRFWPIERIICRRYSKKEIKTWWRDLPRFLLLYEGVHTVDLILSMAKEFPIRVGCSLYHGSIPNFRGETGFELSLDFGSGLTAYLEHDMNSEDECNEIKFICRNATIQIDDFSAMRINGKLIRHMRFSEAMEHAIRAELSDFMGCISSCSRPKCTVESILPVMRCIDIAYSNVDGGGIL